jgi:hypothetical protein
MKSATIIFCIAIMLFTAGCDPHDGKLTIVNSTDDTIFYSLSYDNDSILFYPINQKNGKDNYKYSDIIQPNSETHELVMDTWEYFINTKCKDSTLRIFFFSKELIETAGKDSIMNHQLFSKREKVKVKDLEKLNWRVTFP